MEHLAEVRENVLNLDLSEARSYGSGFKFNGFNATAFRQSRALPQHLTIDRFAAARVGRATHDSCGLHRGRRHSMATRLGGQNWWAQTGRAHVQKAVLGSGLDMLEQVQADIYRGRKQADADFRSSGLVTGPWVS